MQYFLETSDTIPKGLGFSHYDATHLAWLAVFLLFTAGSCLLYRRYAEKGRRNYRRIFAGLILLDEAWKWFWLIVGGNWTVDYLPLHLCSINIILIAIHAWKPSRLLDNFLYMICIPGALAALLFPTWTKLPMANFMYWHSFTVHVLLAAYPITLLAGKDIRPNPHYILPCLGLLGGMAIPIYFFNLAFDTNYMFLMYASKGNPLKAFEDLLGNHLYGFPIIFVAVIAVMYGIPWLVVRICKKKPCAKAEQI
ncbi:MAG: YwaF family protein [Clostridia bacterium]|nr:YwaF family protein [Clostridia bacterium]